MEKYLNATQRPIVYACSWPAYMIDQNVCIEIHIQLIHFYVRSSFIYAPYTAQLHCNR